MGLLMIAVCRLRIVEWRRRQISLQPFVKLFFVILLVVGFYGCSNLQLLKTPQNDSHQWQQYGGTIERTNGSSSLLQPPLSVAWMYDASAGYSEYSVTIADSIVYIGTLLGEVYAVHAHTGENIGSYDFESAIYGAPVVDHSMLYVATANSEVSLYGFDLMKGRVVWKAALGGIETSPLLLGDNLFVTTLDGDVYSINKHTGTANWKFLTPLFERPAFLRSSPASDGKSLVFGCDDGSVFCISIEDGKLLWHSRTEKSVVASPSIWNGRVFVGSQDGAMYAFNLSDGALVWKQSLGSPIYSSQAVGEHYVYAGTSSGDIVCLKSETGEILWRHKAQSAISCAPLLAGKVLYVGSLDRSLYALDADTGTLLWNETLEGRIKSMPVVWNEFLVLPLDNKMVVGMKRGGGE
ncbi:MAG: hypothetical protein EPO24_01655 [Bacteroidetes bacterium]|nr:MAG: hypothetical protein EPO24_01655 [Bacteroidota bacterium]